MCSVRGIGVAVSVRTSIDSRSVFELFLMLHSETLFLVDDEKSQILEANVFLQNAVRADKDIDLAGGSLRQMMARCSAGERKRLSASTRTGNAAKRSVKVSKCCCARIVVGTRRATCLPSMTALNAARTATSVFP